MRKRKFTIRTLLVLTLVAGCAFGYVQSYDNQFRRDLKLLNDMAETVDTGAVWVESNEGISMLSDSLIVTTTVEPPGILPLRSRLRKLEWFKRVRSVRWTEPVLTPAQIEILKSLSGSPRIDLNKRYFTRYTANRLRREHGLDFHVADSR